MADPRNDLRGAWLLEIYSNDIGFVRTVVRIETEDSTFEGHSREGVSGDILGWWTDLLAGIFSNDFEDGALIHLHQGTFTHTGGGTSFRAIFGSALGAYRLDGSIIDGRMQGELSRGRLRNGTIRGSKILPQLPLENYSSLARKIVDTTEAHFYHSGLAASDNWIDFRQEFGELSAKAGDDVEMIFSFYNLARSLPFSHFYLYQNKSDTLARPDTSQSTKDLTIEDISDSVILLRISSFAGSSAAIDSVFAMIIAKQKPYLVIDLRGNQGGNISAMRVISHLIDSEVWGGVFVTRKWFETHAKPPTINSYSQFPLLDEANLDLLFRGLHNEPGVCLKARPAVHRYRGKVSVLTDRQTASACEPLVFGLKKHHLATIIGERTAGAMLNGEQFSLDASWTLTIPTAEYYTPDGSRIDQIGVEPDIEVDAEEALSYALRHLK